MEIARVELSGFKSFVDPAELRILPGLTVVVRPNGCGKSNLLEAIPWAMGEGSPKSVWGGAMDDAIFAGTAARPQRQFAEVSILADTDTRYLIVTHNAVTTARMHRLYGATMVDPGISRLVPVDLGSAEALLAAE